MGFAIFLLLLTFAKVSKCAVGCDQILNTPQNYQILGFFGNKDWFLLENLNVFNYVECCKFPVEGPWSSKNSQSVQSLFFLLRKLDFPKVRHDFFTIC